MRLCFRLCCTDHFLRLDSVLFSLVLKFDKIFLVYFPLSVRKQFNEMPALRITRDSLLAPDFVVKCLEIALVLSSFLVIQPTA